MTRSATLLAILLLIAGNCVAQNSVTKLVNDLVERQMLSNDNPDRLNRVLKFLTKGTPFDNQWQVNQPAKANYLNVFLLRSGLRTDPKRPVELKPYFGSCAYLGEANIVLCDADFLTTFLEKRNIRSFLRSHPDKDAQWERYQDSFLIWVLGHELGHIVKGHSASHFGEDSFEQLVNSTSLDQRQEVNADAFLVDRVLANKDQTLNLSVMLIDVLNAEIRSKVGNDLPQGAGIIFDYNNQKVVRYMTLRRHPEFVVRITRMLQQIGKSKGYEGMKSMTDAFAKHMREG
jgi:hypothetical protein